jgi:hypothetical protein
MFLWKLALCQFMIWKLDGIAEWLKELELSLYD